MGDLLNPTFDVDLSSWSKVDADASVAWTRDVATFFSGAASTKMVQTIAGANDWIETHISGLIGGKVYQVSVWVNCTVFTAGASGNQGLLCVGDPSTTTSGVLITAATAGWVKLTASIKLAPGDTGMDVRLYAPQGTIFYDELSLKSGLMAFLRFKLRRRDR